MDPPGKDNNYNFGKSGTFTMSYGFILAVVMSVSYYYIEARIFNVIHNNCSRYKRICSVTSEAFLIIQANKVNFANDIWRGLEPMQLNH